MSAFLSLIYGLLTGILMDLETPDPSAMDEELSSQYDDLIRLAQSSNDKALNPDSAAQEHYEIPTKEINGKRSVSRPTP